MTGSPCARRPRSPRGCIAHAEKLRVIGRAGIGVDNIDVAAATQRGIVVMNTPYGNSITAAEHTIALLFALCRQIPAADRSTQAGKWEKSRFMGVELTGKTLGVIGCGNVGAAVAERALGLRMKVIAYDPFLSPERARDLGVEKVPFETLLARADFITLHTPLSEATRNLIDRRALAMTKPGVRLINCARGGLVVEEDLAAALDSGHVAGAAIDVFAEEPARREPALRPRQRRRHPASRRFDERGAGERRPADRRADGRFPVDGCGLERGQRAVTDRRGGPAAQPLYEARRAARQLCRAADRDRHHARSPSNTKGRSPSSTSSR